MEITRYIIWTTSFEDTNKIMEILTPHSSVIVSISDRMLCTESKLTAARIRYYIGDDMEMACLEMDVKFINKLMTTKFVADEKKNFARFLEMTKAPISIDEALDLINTKGGVEHLNERELAALDRLTNKAEPKELPPHKN
jgi:hypothetical protein